MGPGSLRRGSPAPSARLAAPASSRATVPSWGTSSPGGLRGVPGAVRARYEPSASDSFQPLPLRAAFQPKMRRFVVPPTGVPQPQIKKHGCACLFFFSLARFTFLLLVLSAGRNLLLILYNGNTHQSAAPKSVLRPNSWEWAEAVSERAAAADRLPAAPGQPSDFPCLLMKGYKNTLHRNALRLN